jgi:GT2 family glycosyltransferase
MNLVSIVILNWNGKAHLEKFLPGLMEHTRMEGAEIVVADNASGDGSVQLLEKGFPGIRLIRFDRNWGFAGGYNRALEQLDSKYYLLLNSDIEVTGNWLEPLIDHMEHHEDCAACTPKIRDYQRRTYFEYAGAAGGYIDRYGYPFCRGRIFDRLEEDRGQYDRVTEVFWASGACMLIRAGHYREAGGLDDNFFAHMEEIDLCWRLKRMGYSIFFIPSSTVYHVGGGTLSRGNPMKTFLNFRNNLLLLYKNLPPGKRSGIMCTRKVLDAVSAFRFLFQGSFGDFRAVAGAHMSFYRMKREYREAGTGGRSAVKEAAVGGIYPRSIVIQFFLKGRKSFSDLNWTG